MACRRVNQATGRAGRAGLPEPKIKHLCGGRGLRDPCRRRLITRMVNKAPSTPRASGRATTETSSSTRKRRTRGRPKNSASDGVRDKLLAAARDLFLRYGYRAVSSRQIASAAHANV